jgi:hypothetical protein
MQSVIATALALNLTMLQAASPAIGTATAKGAFRMNDATVTGNATLLEGATIETNSVGSSMELSSGAKLTLGAESKGRIFGDHAVLERGQGQMDKTAGFRLEARGLTIQPETGNATGRVLLVANNKVEVAALTGSFRVLNSRGVLVAKLPQGIALAFEPQATGLTTLTGTLEQKGGHYILTDETTHVTVELSGDGLDKMVGKRVQVSGRMDPTATPSSDASQVIRVSGVQGAQGGTAPAGTSGTAGVATHAGMRVTTIALLAGGAVAGTVGGLAAISRP